MNDDLLDEILAVVENGHDLLAEESMKEVFSFFDKQTSELASRYPGESREKIHKTILLFFLRK